MIFTCVGLYILIELILLVPFYYYCFGKFLSLSRWLHGLAIPIFYYPLMIYTLSTFSIYPLVTNLITNPKQIGRKENFHHRMYEYCRDSKDKEEFNLKLVIINYVCIQSYFATLKETYDPEYYQFADKLYHTPLSELSNIKLS
eukprot:176597_1